MLRAGALADTLNVKRTQRLSVAWCTARLSLAAAAWCGGLDRRCALALTVT